MTPDLTDHADAIVAAYDVVLLDVGDTLVAEAEPATPTAHLVAEPLPGVLDALRLLDGRVRFGAVTNTTVMREADVRSILAPSGLDALLDVVVTSTDVGIAKPDPRPVLAALEQLGADPGRALLVGDRDTDGDAARAAGVRFTATDRGLTDALVRASCATSGALTAALSAVTPLDADAMACARARHDTLTKPPGSLGRVEDLGALLAGISGRCPPPIPNAPAVAVFAADHGVTVSGVTPWPQSVTAQMLANFAADGAAINAIAAQVGATVCVIDVGVASGDDAPPGVDRRRVRAGTADIATGPAMTVVEARAALDAGAEVAADLLVAGHDLLVTGDMGIGNTTASAALISVLTGQPGAAVTGRGTGIDDGMLRRKTGIVDAAAARARGLLDPVSVLAEVGGLEIGAIAGFIVGGVAARVPVVLDGVIALAALLVAERLAPGIAASVVAGHRSTEPGATVVLEQLELLPVLDLGMRLGEGTGACLAVPVVQAAARVLAQMATFEEAAVGDEPSV